MPSPAEDWTTVPPKSSRRGPKPPPPQNPRLTNPPSRSITATDIRTDFDRKTKIWLGSACRRTLFDVLRRVRRERGAGAGNVRRAVCVGSGSLGRENGECRRRSMWQVVAFVDVCVRFLGRGKEEEEEEEGVVEMFVQEPMYTDVDREFWEGLGLGVEVLDVGVEGGGGGGLGAAGEVLGPETLLFEPFVDMNEAMVRDIMRRDVGLYVGSSMRGLMGRGGVVGQLAGKFVEGRRMVYFPGFDVDANVFEGLGIYWKEEEEEEEEEQDSG